MCWHLRCLGVSFLMRKRSPHQRICKSCSKEETVRSDQLNCLCKDCSAKQLQERLAIWRANNREQFLTNCGNANRKHGLHKSRIYRIHKSMLERCGHKNFRHKWAKYYEDKGARVCDEWLKFELFLAWSMGSGYTENLTIDRIDGSKGYSPDNCRWATRKEQQQNRSNSRSTRWSSVAPTCIVCESDKRRHISFGLCSACYQSQRLLKLKGEPSKIP